MANIIHVIPHFHWDREWYFTSEESKVLLVRDMEEVMGMLEQNPEYPCFVLDGQTAVLEDYFSVKPESRGRVKRLVEQGKLIIGPWYTQTDEMVVGGESIVRNLLYGKLDCEEFGDRMMIGYLPDSFGQSARLPQILNGFGIQRCMFWRGTSERMGTDKTEFYWDDETGARVTVQLLPLGYAIGKYLPEGAEALRERMDKYLPVLDKGAVTDDILLPNGHDQMPVQKNIFSVMEKIEEIYPGRKTVLGRYEDVFDEVEKAGTAGRLAVLKGEFLDGKYMRVHRSIYSSRADLKSANTRIENKITNLLEPLMSIAYALGFSYERGLLEAIWKELMKNHAHDSIGCCCSDQVHRMIGDRFFLAEERTDQLIRYTMREIVDAMPCDEALDKLTVFHLLPYERNQVVRGEIVTKMKGFRLVNEEGREVPFEIVDKEIVDAGVIDRQIVHYGDYDPFVKYTVEFQDVLPAMGYRTYLVKEDGSGGCEAVLGKEDGLGGCESVLENEYYRIEVQGNGTLEILDKEIGEVYRDVLLLEDGSDDGDEYDYSPLEQDYVVDNRGGKARVEVRQQRCSSEAVIGVEMKVPGDLESRRKRICDSTFCAELLVTLKAGSPVIEVEVKVDNQSKDHRVRVLVPNNLPAECSVSDNQFGSIKRPVTDPAMAVWEEERWSERPDSIYPFLSYVHAGTEKGMAVLSNSVREYEITGERFDTIAVTLFRSVGVLGKENLYRRPGRPSGIKLETPDSQLIGRQTYQIALTTHVAEAAKLAREYVTPVVSYNKMPYNAMKLNPAERQTPYSYSLLRIAGDQVILSALKKAEKKEALVIRCFHAGEAKTTGRLETELRPVGEVNLDESWKETWKGEEFEILGNQVRSFMMERG